MGLSPSDFLISNRKLGLGPRAARMRTIRMTRELHHLAVLQHKHLLQFPSNILEYPLALLGAPALAPRYIPFATARNTLAYSLRPQSDTVEAAADIDHHAHDFAIVVVFEGLANGSEGDVQPEVVDGRGFALEAVGPFAAVFVLGIFPFRAHAFFEEVVVGFERQFGDGGDVVLEVK